MKLTLGLGELILLNTGLDSLVELRVENTLRSQVDLVVHLNILLDSLTTKIGGRVQSVTLFIIITRIPPIPKGIGDERKSKTPETYLLPLRSLSYTQKDQSAMRTHKKQELNLLWLSMPKGKDVSRSGATRITTTRLARAGIGQLTPIMASLIISISFKSAGVRDQSDATSDFTRCGGHSGSGKTYHGKKCEEQ
jgi:hypothetical protein